MLPTLQGDDVFSIADLLKLAQLCNATYILPDNKTVVESLDMTYVADLMDKSCPVTIALWGGFKVCAFQGTRVIENLDIVELWDDVNGNIVHLDGMRVHAGFYKPLAEMMPNVINIMNTLPGQPLITGHSLGGVRSHLAKAFFSTAQIVSFGAPKGADDAFWSHYYPDYPPTRVVHEKDFAPGWPYDGPWTQPSKLTWLHEGNISIVENRGSGMQISISDHSIDKGYIAALTLLSQSQVIL